MGIKDKNKLTPISVRNVGPGWHSDGAGLYLRVGTNSARSWALRFRLHGKRRSMGLGSADTVSLAAARKERDRWNDVIASGVDPIHERERLSHEAVDRTATLDILRTSVSRRGRLRSKGTVRPVVGSPLFDFMLCPN